MYNSQTIHEFLATNFLFKASEAIELESEIQPLLSEICEIISVFRPRWLYETTFNPITIFGDIVVGLCLLCYESTGLKNKNFKLVEMFENGSFQYKINVVTGKTEIHLNNQVRTF